MGPGTSRVAIVPYRRHPVVSSQKLASATGGVSSGPNHDGRRGA